MPTTGMDSHAVHPLLVRRDPDTAQGAIPKQRGYRTTEGKPKMLRPGRSVKRGHVAKVRQACARSLREERDR
jgi:hypothetical protein